MFLSWTKQVQVKDLTCLSRFIALSGNGCVEITHLVAVMFPDVRFNQPDYCTGHLFCLFVEKTGWCAFQCVLGSLYLCSERKQNQYLYFLKGILISWTELNRQDVKAFYLK